MAHRQTCAPQHPVAFSGHVDSGRPLRFSIIGVSTLLVGSIQHGRLCAWRRRTWRWGPWWRWTRWRSTASAGVGRRGCGSWRPGPGLWLWPRLRLRPRLWLRRRRLRHAWLLLGCRRENLPVLTTLHIFDSAARHGALRCPCEHGYRGSVVDPDQILIDGAGAEAALADRPHYQRLAAAHVAGGEHVRHRGLVVGQLARTLPR